MKRYWALFVAFIAGALGGVFAWRKRQPQPLSAEQIKQAEQQYALAVAEKQKQIEVLKQDLYTHLGTIRSLEREVDAQKEALTEVYKDSGRTAEEIADAFRGLQL